MWTLFKEVSDGDRHKLGLCQLEPCACIKKLQRKGVLNKRGLMENTEKQIFESAQKSITMYNIDCISSSVYALRMVHRCKEKGLAASQPYSALGTSNSFQFNFLSKKITPITTWYTECKENFHALRTTNWYKVLGLAAFLVKQRLAGRRTDCVCCISDFASACGTFVTLSHQSVAQINNTNQMFPKRRA